MYAENAYGLSDPDGINIVMPGGVPPLPTTKRPGECVGEVCGLQSMKYKSSGDFFPVL